MIRRLLLLLLCLLPLVGSAKEYTPSEVPNVQVVDQFQFVSDPEGYFSAEDRARINDILFNLRERHTVEIVLVVLPGIVNDDPERFTLELFELWGVGKSIDDNGLLVLYKYGESGQRIIRFEVGYGLEGALPDITTKRITDRYIVPAVLEGRDAEGFVQAFQEVDKYLTEGYVARGENQVYGDHLGQNLKTLGWAYFLFSVFVGILFGGGLIAMWRKEKEPADQVGVLYRRYKNQWWLILIFPALLFLYPLYLILRGVTNKRISDCPSCKTKGSVSVLTHPKNLPYLNTGQVAEERVGSVHHHVYACSVCDYHKVVEQPNLLTGYRRCSRCGYKTFHFAEQYRTHNHQIQKYSCAHCGHDLIRRIPIGDSGGGFGGGFGGSGGGSFGGGFGGGMSGGGGSTTRF